MERGSMPADGEVLLGPVRLPPGRRIERPGISLTMVGEIASYIKDAPFWGFWWD